MTCRPAARRAAATTLATGALLVGLGSLLPSPASAGLPLPVPMPTDVLPTGVLPTSPASPLPTALPPVPVPLPTLPPVPTLPVPTPTLPVPVPTPSTPPTGVPTTTPPGTPPTTPGTPPTTPGTPPTTPPTGGTPAPGGPTADPSVPPTDPTVSGQSVGGTGRTALALGSLTATSGFSAGLAALPPLSPLVADPLTSPFLMPLTEPRAPQVATRAAAERPAVSDGLPLVLVAAAAGIAALVGAADVAELRRRRR